MKIWTDLFSTDYGLMSVAVLTLMLLIGAFMLHMFVNKMNADA